MDEYKQDLCCGANSSKAAAFFNQGERGSGNVAIGLQEKKERKKSEVQRGKAKFQLAKLSWIQLRFTSLVLGSCESSRDSKALFPKISSASPSESNVQVDVQQPSPLILSSSLKFNLNSRDPQATPAKSRLAK